MEKRDAVHVPSTGDHGWCDAGHRSDRGNLERATTDAEVANPPSSVRRSARAVGNGHRQQSGPELGCHPTACAERAAGDIGFDRNLAYGGVGGKENVVRRWELTDGQFTGYDAQVWRWMEAVLQHAVARLAPKYRRRQTHEILAPVEIDGNEEEEWEWHHAAIGSVTENMAVDNVTVAEAISALSHRDALVCQMAAAGFRQEDIARQMSITARTVRRVMKRAQQVLQAELLCTSVSPNLQH